MVRGWAFCCCCPITFQRTQCLIISHILHRLLGSCKLFKTSSIFELCCLCFDQISHFLSSTFVCKFKSHSIMTCFHLRLFVNAILRSGWSPLHSAAVMGHAQVNRGTKKSNSLLVATTQFLFIFHFNDK